MKRQHKAEVEQAIKEGKPIPEAVLSEYYNSQPVEKLVDLKKQLYSDVDIESPKAPEEKLLDKVIAAKWSEVNQRLKDKRKESELAKQPEAAPEPKQTQEEMAAAIDKFFSGDKKKAPEFDPITELRNVNKTGVASSNDIARYIEAQGFIKKVTVGPKKGKMALTGAGIRELARLQKEGGRLRLKMQKKRLSRVSWGWLQLVRNPYKLRKVFRIVIIWLIG